MNWIRYAYALVKEDLRLNVRRFRAAVRTFTTHEREDRWVAAVRREVARQEAGAGFWKTRGQFDPSASAPPALASHISMWHAAPISPSVVVYRGHAYRKAL